MCKISAFSFDACRKSFVKAQKGLANCVIRQIVLHSESKNCTISFCNNFVKLSSVLMIFGTFNSSKFGIILRYQNRYQNQNQNDSKITDLS